METAHARLAILSVLALLALPLAAATTYIVDGSSDGCDGASCSDANDGLTESTAFATPHGCIEHMQGGDTCLLKNGTYASGSGEHWLDPGLNFCISGTAEQPTTIKAYPGHEPLFCSTPDCADNPDTPTIGAFSYGACNHITFDGLEVDGCMLVGSDWGSDPEAASHHIRVTNNELRGGCTDDGNYAPLRLNNGRNYHVSHNTIHDISIDAASGYQSSASGIKLYCARSSTIEYNTIDARNAAFGIHDKDTSVDNTIRYNEIYGPAEYTSLTGIGINGQQGCGLDTTDTLTPRDTSVYANVVRDVTTGVRLYEKISRPSVTYNTFTRTGSALYVSGDQSEPVTEAVFTHNLVEEPVQNADGRVVNVRIKEPAWSEFSGYTFDHNAYSPDAIYEEDVYGDGYVAHTTLAGWQAATGQEASSTEESASGVGAYSQVSCVGSSCGDGAAGDESSNDTETSPEPAPEAPTINATQNDTSVVVSARCPESDWCQIRKAVSGMPVLAEGSEPEQEAVDGDVSANNTYTYEARYFINGSEVASAETSVTVQAASENTTNETAPSDEETDNATNETVTEPEGETDNETAPSDEETTDNETASDEPAQERRPERSHRGGGGGGGGAALARDEPTAEATPEVSEADRTADETPPTDESISTEETTEPETLSGEVEEGRRASAPQQPPTPASGSFGENLASTLFQPKPLGMVLMMLLGTITVLLVAR